LLNHQSWEFDPGLFLDTVAPREGNDFGSAAAAGIVPLTTEEEARVLAHPFHQIPLLRSSISADRKLYGEQAAKKRGAPPPTEGARRGIMHMRDAPAYVYWFHLVINGKIVGHKIGWAFEWKQRGQQFNSVSLAALGGLLYKEHRVQQFDTARQAFTVEQKILRSLDHKRHPSNREVLTGVASINIESVWDEIITSVMVGHR